MNPMLRTGGMRLPMDDWATEFRQINGGPLPGPWDFDNCPMAREPMQAASSPEVRLVSMCAPAQLMKSEYCINIALWTAYYGHDCLVYEPDLHLGGEFMTERIRPAMNAMDGSEKVAIDKMGPRKRDSVGAIRYAGGGLVRLLTPAQKTGKSGHTAPVVVIDEIDKMGDTGMVTVARSRTRTFETDALIAAASTPTVDEPGTIWRMWTEGSRGVWHGRCPHCDQLSALDWGQVLFERDREGYWLPETAKLHCSECGTEWTEADRKAAVRNGEYIHERPEKTAHRSFHVPGLAHMFGSFRDIVREGATLWRGTIESEDWAPYILWYNERLALPWNPDIEGISARKLEQTTFDLGALGAEVRGELDHRAVLLTAAADVGAREIFTEFTAWGVDLDSGNVICWGLEYVEIGGDDNDSIEEPYLWEQWSQVLERGWMHPFAGGTVVPARRVVIDCGFRPEIVKSYCRGMYAAQLKRMPSHQQKVRAFGARVLPLLSRAIAQDQHPVDLRTGEARARHNPAEHVPATVLINSNQIKDFYYESLLRDRRLPEGQQKSNVWPELPSVRGYTADYFKQMANERKVVHRTPTGQLKTHWEVKAGLAKHNDAFDCRIYNCAAAMVCVYPRSLQVGLLRLAAADAAARGSAWSAEERVRINELLGKLQGRQYEHAAGFGDADANRMQSA